jgi:acetyl-CoA carboxylase alpha subunit
VTHGRDGEAVSVSRRSYAGHDAVVAEWIFQVRGGTFGAAEAAAFVAACHDAAESRLPLVTVLRSGGTRLQEGMRALVGIPRATLALQEVARAGVPHVCVADHPTTGGVWVAVGAAADVRAAVAGATVGFSGPRVVEAMTGTPLPPGANTAESAHAHGLVDALVPQDRISEWVGSVLGCLADDGPDSVAPATSPAEVPDRHGWTQVEHSRHVFRPAGQDLLCALADQAVPLRGGDSSVAAAIARVLGRRVVITAVAAERAGRVTPAGYRLFSRAAALAARLRLPLVGLVDTAGADPTPPSETAAVVSEIGAALTAMLACPSPTVAIVHGEGGSGGALAAAVADIVAVTGDAWFAALAPEGAAAAMRTAPAGAADLMRVAPAELIADGFADECAPTDPVAMKTWLAARLDALGGLDPVVRLEQRRLRWAGPLRKNPSTTPPLSE